MTGAPVYEVDEGEVAGVDYESGWLAGGRRTRRPHGVTVDPLAELAADLDLGPNFTGARCIGVDVFDTGRGNGASARAARLAAVCAGCPVRVPCLRLALERREEYGVWGGTTPEQRALIFDRISSGRGTIRTDERAGAL